MSFSVPRSLARLAIEVEGWIDLGCAARALTKIGPLLDHPGARPAGLALRVRALVDIGRFADALAHLQELRSLPHDTEWLAITEGWCRRRTEDLPGAIRCMEELITTSRSSAIGHYNLACYLSLSARIDEAVRMLAHAVALDAKLRSHARTEQDFDSIRSDERFLALIEPAE